MTGNLRIDLDRLLGRLDALAEIGAIEGGGVCRLALSDAPNCASAMIFVPSQGGISHNVAEYTAPEDLRAGADVLLQVLLAKANESDGSR